MALSAKEPYPTANRSNRWRFSSAGNSSKTPSSREFLAQSRSKSYCHCSWRPPNHCIPLGETTQKTLARSHGPRHPEIVSCTDLLSFSSFHCCLIQSRGNGSNPLSVRPQQQPSQNTICPRMRPRAVANGSHLPSVKLPQFRGHLSSWRGGGGGVHDAEVETAVRGGIPTADGRAGSVRTYTGRPRSGVRAVGRGDTKLGRAG